MTYEEFSKEHDVWLKANFPNQPPEHPAVGMIEEAGELMHVLLKLSQEHTWGAEPRYAGNHWGKKLVDAVGDCAIYCDSFCNAKGYSFPALAHEALCMDINLSFVAGVTLVHHALNVHSTHSESQVHTYLSQLKSIAHRAGISLNDAITDTWAEVKLRNRTNMRKPRVVCLCGSTRFKQAWYEQNKRLTHEGKIVLGVGDLDPNAPNTNVPIDAALKARLDALHLCKIEMADEVLILNVGGYIGESTKNELAHAKRLGKDICFLEPEKALDYTI